MEHTCIDAKTKAISCLFSRGSLVSIKLFLTKKNFIDAKSKIFT